tara:strand:- start:2376 stop:2675 length:300 start_codon:yes stop_codon:yes gene_type:complete
MAYTVLPIAGVDLVDTQTATELAASGTTVPTFGPLGAETFANDGRRYVFAKAGEAITASTSTCSINTTTFVATASAGTYLAPTTTMASGDYGWFSKASV